MYDVILFNPLSNEILKFEKLNDVPTGYFQIFIFM